ncbi:MAG: Gfo/Idh/MocA family protein [Candidatus Limnocylindrales bacterium]
MRVALLGAGRIGQLHARVLAARPEIDAVILVDADPERARTVAAEVGGETAISVEDALDQADAVVIATPTDSHPSLVRAALERRVPTFCEKPLSLDLADAAELVDQVQVSGVPFQVGFQRRFDPGFREARRLVEAGDLGTVYLVRLIAHDHEPPPENYIQTSGGLFRDSSIHDFDVLRWITGQEVDEVYAAGSVRAFDVFARHGDVDTAAVILRLADGTIAQLGQTRHDSRGYDVRMEIVGSRDSVAVGLGPRTPIRLLEADPWATDELAWPSFLDRFAIAYADELQAFVQVALGRRPSPCTAFDALQALRISDAASRSVVSNQPVRLNPAPPRDPSPSTRPDPDPRWAPGVSREARRLTG